MKLIKGKTIIDINKISSEVKENKIKIDSIFMDIEYIRCPVTEVIVVNENLFKGE